MRENIIFRLNEVRSLSDNDFVQWVRMSEGNTTPIATSRLSELADLVQGANVIALAPSTEVLLGSVKVPTQNRQKMLKAIPFALEDQLADDIDDLHFAVGQRNTEGYVASAVISRRQMDYWQAMFREAGLSINALIPDILALPAEANVWVLYIGQQEALLRTGLQSGFAMDADNVSAMLALSFAELEEEQLPHKIEVWSEISFNEILDQIRDNIPESVEIVQHGEAPHANGFLSLLVNQGFDQSKTINLLQGDYSRREQLGKLWRPWRLAASLAAIWFVLQLVISISENSVLDERNAQLKAEVIQIFKETFPEIKRIVNVRAQMEQKLKEISGGSTNDHESFIVLAMEAGAALTKASGLVMRSIRYKNGELDVEVEVPNLQVLDKLKQDIGATNKLSVKIQSASQKDNKVQGRLQIKRVS